MRTLQWMVLCAGMLWLSAHPRLASAETYSEPEERDATFIPAGAKEVRQVSMFGNTNYSFLNEHMIIAWAEMRPYLLWFDRCPALGRHDAQIMVGYGHVRSLHAATDIVTVNGTSCVIDRIYQITGDDATALKKRFPRR